MGGGRVIEANDRSGREEKRRRAQTAAKLLCHFHWSHPHLPIQPAPLVYETSFTFLIMYASGFLFAASPLLWLWPQKPTPLWHNIWVIAPKFSILIPFPCVDPAVSIARMRFPLEWRARFLFWKIDFYWLRKMTWSRHLFLFYF